MNILPIAAIFAVSYITYRVLATNSHVDTIDDWSRSSTFSNESYDFPLGSTLVVNKVGDNLYELNGSNGKKTVASMALKRYSADPRFTLIFK